MPAWRSDEERERIRGLSEGGFSIRAIARTVKRSRDAVKRALVASRRNRRQPRRKPIVSERLL
ncbi:hypothetical protein PC128_g16897 [Phytophthora cactorum]|nr:hypothetical protein PC128_g16897 [Phytophthora cactorum]